VAEDEGFLQRWARRKAEHRAPAGGDTAAPTPEPENTPPVQTDAGEGTQALDLDALPDIESLDAGSDFSIFMQDGVPDALRTRALQKLWRLDPDFGHIDGLLEYAENYTDSSVAMETVRTIYQAGKGMLGDGGAEEAAMAGPAADAQSADDEAAGTEPLPAPDQGADAAPDAATDDHAEPVTAGHPGDPKKPG
jgi:Protein of unknown function (DUF3306)